MKRVLLLLLTLGVFAGAAYAHNGMQHVMGTVTAITNTSITVKTTDGKAQSVAVTGDTKYSKADATVTLKEIKVGDHIVIHTTRKGDQLTAAEVKVATMKMDSKSRTTPHP